MNEKTYEPCEITQSNENQSNQGISGSLDGNYDLNNDPLKKEADGAWGGLVDRLRKDEVFEKLKKPTAKGRTKISDNYNQGGYKK